MQSTNLATQQEDMPRHHDLYSQVTIGMAQAMGKLDPDVYREYRQAMEDAPDLVQNESRPMDFLRTDNYDFDKAVMRLALYWKYRKEIFGNRWLLPLTQTGAGALSMDDVEVLRSGWVISLTRPFQSNLVVIDISRLCHAPGYHTGARIVFYYLSAFCNDEIAQTEGVTILHVVTSASRPGIRLQQEAWKKILTCCPFRIKDVVVAQSQESGREHLIDSLAYHQTRATEYNLNVNPQRIEAESSNTTLQMLQSKDILSDHIPESLGGRYKYSAFDDWIGMRISLEDVMSAAPWQASLLPRPGTVTNYTHNYSTTTTALVVAAATAAGPRGHSSFAASGPQRQRNATNNRRHYKQQQQRMQALQEEKSKLVAKNTRLRQNNRWLEGMLAQGRLIAAVHTKANDKEAEESSGRPNMGGNIP